MAQSIYQPYEITTFAGVAGAYGTADGTGNNARFSGMQGVAVNASGIVYVADTNTGTIRKITPQGVVTTLAGLAGVSGSDDGLGSAARFTTPYSLVTDGAGNIYVSDFDVIRKVTPAGLVSTLAGVSGVSGSADGVGSAARFYNPAGIAVDGAGTVYVADSGNDTIRKITPAGVVTTLAGLAGAEGSGDGVGNSARFYHPYGLAVTNAGVLFVADTYNSTIRKIAVDGTVSTFGGSASQQGSADGSGSAARFLYPEGLALDGAGNVYVADMVNTTIRKITSSGLVRTLAGLARSSGSNDAAGAAARFNYPAGIAVNSSGTVYVADTSNFTIRAGVAVAPPPPPPSALDQSFNAGSFTNGQVYVAVLQPDGKLVISGDFNKVHGVARHRLARFNVDGTLDTSFAAGEGLDFPILEFGGGILVQTDGKMVIFNGFATVNGVPRPASIARLNNDGSLDSGFDPGRVISLDGLDDGFGNATSPGYVDSAVLLPDGKLIVVGDFSYVLTGPGTKISRFGVARFNSDGSFDPSFDPGTGCTSNVPPSIGVPDLVVRQTSAPNNGKLVLQGSFDHFDGHPVPGIVRLNPDGSYDATFSANLSADDSVFSMIVGANDRIVLGIYTANGGFIRRLNSDGSVDSSFSSPSFADYTTGGVIDSMVEQADGKLVAVGSFRSLDGIPVQSVARLLTNGARDPSFNSANAAGASAFNVSTVVLRPSDGHMFFGGYFSTYSGALRNNIAWVDEQGVLDSTFARLSGVTDYAPQVYALAVQPNGKILVGGFFSSFNGASHYNLVRLNPDATIDPSFDPSVQTEGSIRAIYLQPDGKILIAGNIRALNGVSKGRIARLMPDGTPDPSFVTGVGADSTILALTEDSAGNIYLGGNLINFNGTSRRRLAKLSPTGVLDQIFDPGSGPNGNVNALALADAAGGIVIGLTNPSYQGTNVGRIARVNAISGARDPSFNSGGSGFDGGAVYSLRLGPDGKYYAAGLFSSFNGVPRSGVSRLNSDGSLDFAFGGAGIDGGVFAAALQSDRLVVGGILSPQPLRLTTTGAPDETFSVGDGATVTPGSFSSTSRVTALATQPDGSVLVGGIFNQIDGVARICLARLTSLDPNAPRINVQSVTRLANGHTVVQAIGFPQTHYTLQMSSSPTAGSFTSGISVTADSTGVIRYEDASAGGLTRRFYRITLP